ncbi:MAG: precorrin-6y C5,15-methyltransferase (decarboxylating) subunit CbiE [Alphaproteobacteria bacterium]
MSAWLTIIGIGEDGLEGLSATARARLAGAQVLVGGVRHLAMIPDDGRQRITWPSPFSAITDTLAAFKPKPVAVLATGNPLWYGVGVTLARHFSGAEMLVLPGPSAFALAGARLGWPMAQVATLSLHGRPAALIEPHIHPRAKLLVLADGARSPREVAVRLVARGFGPSLVHVLEHIGGPQERQQTATAAKIAAPEAAHIFAPFNTIAVECRTGPDATSRAQIPGLPDDAFLNDGQITRAEVRAATLASLRPFPGAVLWDLGAGAGSVAIEWMRASRGAHAIAVEKNSKRADFIRQNAERLGAPSLEVVEAEISASLDQLAPPDAIFIGGGLSRPAASDIIERCQKALLPWGCLVANAVTLASERCLIEAQACFGGNLTRISVSHAEPLGGNLSFKPALPVTQWAYVKPVEAQ